MSVDLPGAVGSDEGDLHPALDLEVEALDDAMRAIGFAQALDLEGRLARVGGRGKGEMDLLHAFGYRDRDDLFELLYPALDEGGLRGLVTEATDEILEPLDLLLLTLPCLERRLELLRPPRLVGRIAAGVARELAVPELVDLAHGRIEEVAVVRYDEDAARVLAEELLEPGSRLDI